MILLLVLALSCVFAAIFLAYGELSGARGTRASLARAAGYGRPIVRVATEPRTTSPGHVIVDGLGRLTMRLSPKRDAEATAERLHAAGFAAVRVEAFLAAKAAVAAAGLGIGAIAGVETADGLAAIALSLVGMAAGFVLPDLFLKARAKSRREEILGELPNALDLLAVTVEAGLGLDAALARFAETSTGPLAEEIALLGTEMRVGAARVDVLQRFAERVPAPETKSFVRAVTQADQLGVSLAGALRQQAADVRVRRQTLAEEKANKAPVKMLFPVVLCIFPTLFVIVLGPSLITLMEAL